jgi:hypothetical protein
MSGFGFRNFGGFDLSAGLSSLSDIGEKLQKFKEDVETTIEASMRDETVESGEEEEEDEREASPGESPLAGGGGNRCSFFFISPYPAQLI